MSFAQKLIAALTMSLLLATCATGELRTFGDSGGGEVDASTSDRAFPPDAPQVIAVDASEGSWDARVDDAQLQRPDSAPLPVDAACTPTVVNLLENPGYDLGPGHGWEQSSSNGWPLILSSVDPDPLPVPAQSGSYGAWLGGDTGEFSILYQDVEVPAGASNLEVAGFYRISTEEPGGNPDVANVQIRDSGGMLVEQLHQWSNLDSTATWTPFSYAPTGDYRGQTIRLYFDGACDLSTALTSFFYDTVALNVTLCM